MSERDVRSRFTTDTLVSTVVSIQYELETVLDRTAARAAIFIAGMYWFFQRLG